MFVVYPLMMLGLGFLLGLGIHSVRQQDKGSSFLLLGLPSGMETQISAGETEAGEEKVQAPEGGSSGLGPGEREAGETEEIDPDGIREVATAYDTLCVDTAYVLEETDILHHTVVEITQRLPAKYVGMNREQFLQAMELYEAFPPLSEMERGFVNLEVLSFSRERVVVQMNYKYVQPSESFYLAAYDNKVIVYLEDRKTLYIETEIPLDSLPEQLQHDIIQMMWIENEEKLYNFLENYSS